MRIRVARAVVVTVSVIAVGTMLAGCQPVVIVPKPTRAQVEGTWAHGRTDLELDDDGGFQLSDIPSGVVGQQAPDSDGKPVGKDVSVTGTWRIGSSGNDAGDAPGVQLDFQDPTSIGPNTGLTFVVSEDQPFRLFVYLGNPDSRVKYELTKR